MIALLLSTLVSVSTPPAVAVVGPAVDVRGIDRAALTTAASTAAQPVASGAVVTAHLPAGACDVRCRLDVAKATGAPLALLLDTGTLADATQVGVVLVELETGRAVAQHAERVAAANANAAVARGVRAVLGKPDAGDATAESAAAANAGTSVRVVIANPKVSPTLGLDAASASSLGTRAATIVQHEAGFVVVTTDEVAAVLKNDKDKADLGAGDTEVFARAAQALEARLLLLVDVGGFGDAALVTGRLVDVQLGEAETQRAELVVDDLSQIPAGVDAVVARLFGRTAPVPAPKASPSRYESAVKKVARGLMPAFLDGSGKSVLVVPFAERGAVPAQMHIGPSTATLLWRTLSEGFQGPQWLPIPEHIPADALGAAKAAGVVVVVSDTVSDVGTDLMIEASAVDVADGSVRARQTVLFPKGDQATLIPLEKLVLKTRGEALFRALVPGGGQFFNGPAHAWKGVVIAAGTGLGVLGGAALIGAASWAGRESSRYDVGGDQAIALGCALDKDNELPAACEQPRSDFAAQADTFRTGAIAAFAAGAAFYVAGFVDAGLSAE